MRSEVLDRLADKFTVGDGCWEWTAALSGKGYGSFDGRGAHRVVYELMVGPVAAGLVLDHLCRVRHCVRPSHLEPVTAGENTLRGLTVTAVNAAKAECPVGHAYDESNTTLVGGRRRCRECHRNQNREWARTARRRAKENQ